MIIRPGRDAGAAFVVVLGSVALVVFLLRARAPARVDDESHVLAALLGVLLALACAGWVYRRRRREQRIVAEARRANESAIPAQGPFLAVMSHELRTPLTAVLGFTDLLLDPNQDPTLLRAHAQTIRRNGRHLLAVINDALDFSKIEAGMLRVERKPCDAEAVVRDVVELLLPRAREKQISIIARVEGTIPRCLASDALRLRQILLNLVANAVAFTEIGGVMVSLRIDGAQLVIEVSDSGIGIGPAEIEHVFTPFRQAETHRTRRYGGTGLGLAISKRLARAMGGDIGVESRVGIGSIFRLVLPAERLDVEPDAASNEVEPSAEEAWSTRPSWRVLLAEDTLDHQRLLYVLLRRTGHAVDVCDDGRRACRKALEADLAGEPYTLIVMDVRLPVLDGLSAVRRIREQGYRGPILAFTADASDEHRERCLAAGCDDVQTKPIDREALLAAMRKLVRGVSPNAVVR